MKDARSKSLPGSDALLLAALFFLGFFLRVKEIDAFRPSPDEGNYMHSARLDVIGRDGGPGRWLAQDENWVGELVRDYPRGEDKTTYPHSYLEQWLSRYAYRVGFGSLASVRLSSAVLGALIGLALYGAAVTASPSYRIAGLLAAFLTEVLPIFVWYSRTGWGQIGCAFFYVLYFALGYRLLDPSARHSRGDLVRLGIALAVVSLLAYGYHEMIVVHVAWLGVIACLAPLWRPDTGRGYLARLLTSPRTWTYALSAIPAAALLGSLALFNPWAQDIWLDASREAPFAERMRLSVEFLLFRTQVAGQITWPVLLLGVLGLVVLLRRDRPFALYAAASMVGGVLPFFLLYSNPSLVRVYLPAIAILVLLAGFGLVFAAERMRSLPLRVLRVALLCALGVYLFAVSWISLFGPMDHPLSVRHFYWTEGQELLESRYSMDPILELLGKELRSGETVGVLSIPEALFALRDADLPVRYFQFGEPREQWPRFLIGRIQHVEGEMNQRFGADHPYEIAVKELAERLALYRLR